MKIFTKFLLLFCIGLCTLVNVGYAQDSEEQPTSEKHAFVIQATGIALLGAGKAASIEAIATNAPMRGIVLATTDIVAEQTSSNVTLDGNELPEIVQRLLIEAELRLCGLTTEIFTTDLDAKPAPMCRDVSKLYNEFPNFKSKLTERFYKYRFSC